VIKKLDYLKNFRTFAYIY